MPTTLKHSLPRAEVLPTAERLLLAIEPHCVCAVIAGSLLRQRPYVGDIEIVAIPIRPLDLFGDPLPEFAQTALNQVLWNLDREGRIKLKKDGPRWKQFSILLPNAMRFQVDLFLTTPERWPVILAIRTGPADFSRRLVTRECCGGLLRDDCCVRDGRVVCNGQLVDLRTERQFFDEFIFGGWLPPEERQAQ